MGKNENIVQDNTGHRPEDAIALLPRDVISPENADEYDWLYNSDTDEGMVQGCINCEKTTGIALWCSTLRRTAQTASHFRNIKPTKWRALSEIETGICDGMTYAQIKEKYPEEWDMRAKDKLTYRYPGGESYKDVIQRLEPVIFELERSSRPVFVIGHRAILRCLYGYFMGTPDQDIPHLDIPLHEVIKLSPGAY